MTPPFDTLNMLDRLEAAGFPREQAAILVYALLDAAGQPVDWDDVFQRHFGRPDPAASKDR